VDSIARCKRIKARFRELVTVVRIETMSVEKKKEEKKEPTFTKIENGMIFTSEDKIMVGLPTQVETKTKAEGALSFLGGKAGGEKYTKVTYDWRVISGSPLPPSEMDKIQESITATSGTVVASLSNATIAAQNLPKCKKCGTPLFIVGKGFNCQKCGEPTTQHQNQRENKKDKDMKKK